MFLIDLVYLIYSSLSIVMFSIRLLTTIASRSSLHVERAAHSTISSVHKSLNGLKKGHLHPNVKSSLGSVPHVVSCHFSSAPPEPRIKVKVRGIQKDVFPLTTKRVVRRKKAAGSEAQDKVRK